MKEEEVKKREIIEKIKYLAREVSQQLSHEEILELRDVLREIDQLDKSEADGQLDKLANFIMSEVEGEPSQNQGVVDAAIRIIKSYQNREVLSLEWVDEHAVYPSFDEWPTEDYVHVGDLQNLIVPKQELPVVPMWFDEWWKDVTKGRGVLFHNIQRFHHELYISGTRETCDYISVPDNKKKLLNIIINELDYEVEEEPLYSVSAGVMKTGFWFLCKDSDGDISIGKNKDFYRMDWDRLKLTEQEIKDYDSRYWTFARPVDEFEE